MEQEENGNENGGIQVIDPQQLAQMMLRGQKKQIPYCDAVKMLMENLKKQKPEDRLSYGLAIAELVNAVNVSMRGWSDWLSNLRTLDNLSLEDFIQIHPKFRKLVLELLALDLEITERKEKEIHEKMKKQQEELEAKLKEEEKKKPKTDKPKKDAYVA